MQAYFISVVCAAVVCGIFRQLVDGRKTTGKLIEAVCGIFLAVTLLSGITDISFRELEMALPDFSATAQDAAAQGEEMADQAMAEIIIRETRTYILNRAQTLRADVDVQVELTDTDPPVPRVITITGSVSPYQKSLLTSYISDTLGVEQENVRWI